MLSILGGFENLAIAVGVAFTAKNAVGLFSFGQSLFAAGQAIAPLASAAIPGLIAGIKAVGFAMMSTPLGWIIGGVAALCAGVWRLVSVWDRLKKAFSTGGVWGAVKTFFGFGDDEEEEPKKAVPGAAMQSAPKPMEQGFSVAPVTRASSPSTQAATAALPMQNASKSQSVQVDVGGITVHAAPGQDPEAIADKVLEKFQALQRDAQNRALYDYA
ncbi:hypothetical protein LWC08_03715 [Desulfobaculum bizertense]|uniref:hypothetical protein n=1 Tax=Desulfobaculum bizertense TaxID=376490 RepID=UPI001F259049|nr:hypothetical protein [Desulfobaculum bizertense]UIJ38686.1 hypothetical protein LWC08_03715 [Desulfobaculum bizertense]